MNLILLFPDDFSDQENRVRLQGRRLRHVLEVHRASIRTAGVHRSGILCIRNLGEVLEAPQE